MMKIIRTFVLALGFILPTIVPNVNAQVFSFKWGSSGSGDGQFSMPAEIAIDSSGNVYITDQHNNRIQVRL